MIPNRFESDTNVKAGVIENSFVSLWGYENSGRTAAAYRHVRCLDLLGVPLRLIWFETACHFALDQHTIEPMPVLIEQIQVNVGLAPCNFSLGVLAHFHICI
jgi:hypothetical protein